jgi:predicted metal-dependent HD superfamily phosphohydrolase
MSRTAELHWLHLWSALGLTGSPRPWHQRLVEAYAEPQRAYHTLQHLNECLIEFDAVRPLAKEPDAVEFALWFHDAVYDPKSTENEEKSAELALKCLSQANARPWVLDRARHLILATKTHQSTADPDAALLLDADLAILGQSSDRYWQYERNIRAEYRWVDEALFRQKRSEILERFLARPVIYQTSWFRERYETSARANLAAALTRLETAF